MSGLRNREWGMGNKGRVFYKYLGEQERYFLTRPAGIFSTNTDKLIDRKRFSYLSKFIFYFIPTFISGRNIESI